MIILIDTSSNNLVCMSCQDDVTRFQRNDRHGENMWGQTSFLPISPRAAMIFKPLQQWWTRLLLLWKRGGLPPLGCYCSPSRPLRPTAPSPNLTSPLPSASLANKTAAFVRGCANVTRCTWAQVRTCAEQQLEADRFIFFLIGRWLGRWESVGMRKRKKMSKVTDSWGREAYRTPRVFGDKFGDEFGDKVGDSLNFVINLVTMLVTHFVRHQICHNFWWKFYHYFWWLTKIITLFCDLFGTTFFSKSEVPNLSQFSVLNKNSWCFSFWQTSLFIELFAPT